MSVSAIPKAGMLIAGRYQIQQELVSKTYGTVSFLARDQATDDALQDKVVLKFLRNAGTDSQIYSQYAKRAKVLLHKNVISQFRVESDDKFGAFIVRKFIPGKNLSEFFKGKSGSNQLEFLDISQQICRALKSLDKKKWLEQGLSSANVIISEEYEVLLIDVLSSTAPNVAVNAGDAPPDSADIFFRLGCILYECACGVNPYAGTNGTRAYVPGRTLQVPPKFNELIPAKKVDAQVELIIFRCIDAARAQGYGSITAIITDLKRVEEGEEIRPLDKAAKGNSNALWIGAIATLAALITLGMGLATTQHDHQLRSKKERPALKMDSNSPLSSDESEADKLYKSGKYDEAADLYAKTQVAVSAKYGNESLDNVRLLHKQSLAELWNPLTGQAKNTYTLLAEIIARHPELSPQKIDYMQEISDSADRMVAQNKTNAADYAYALGFKIAEQYEPNNRPLRYRILIKEGQCEAKEHDFTNGVKSFEKAISAYRNDQSLDRTDLALALTEYANLLIKRSALESAGTKQLDQSNARIYLNEALRIRQENSDKVGVEQIESCLKQLDTP